MQFQLFNVQLLLFAMILNNFYKRQKPVGVMSMELANTKVGSMSFCTYVRLLDQVV